MLVKTDRVHADEDASRFPTVLKYGSACPIYMLQHMSLHVMNLVG